MPLQFQLNQAPFRFGLAEGVDPHQVPWGTLTTAENVVWKKTGRIEKRFGTSALSRSILGGGTLSAGARLLARGSELACIDGTSLYSYSSSLGQWTLTDTALNVGLTWTTLLDTTLGASAVDVATGSNGIACQAWVTGDPSSLGVTGLLSVRLFDSATGEQIQAPTATGTTCYGVRVLASGTTAFVLYRTGTNIAVFSVDLTTGTVNASANLRTDASLTAWDAMMLGSSIVIAYENSVNALKLYKYTYAGPSTYTQSAAGGVTGEAGNTFRSIALDGIASERIWVGYYVNSSTKVRLAAVSDSTLAQTIAPFDVEAVKASNVNVVRDSSTTCIVGYSMTDSTSCRASTVQCTSGSAVTASTKRGTWGTRLVSRIFTLGTRRFAFVADLALNNTTGSYFGIDTALVEVDTASKGVASDWFPHRYVGRVDPLVGCMSVDGMLTGAIVKSSTEALVPVPFLSTAVQKLGNWRCGYRLADVTIGASVPADMWRSVTYGSEAYVAAGLLGAYDGQVLFDYGYPRPPIIFSAPDTSPGGNMAAGTYLYKGGLEFRSRAGVLHRSSVQSLGSVSPAAGSSFVTLNILASSLTAKNKFAFLLGGTLYGYAPQEVTVYRTVVGGSTYYRMSYEPGYNFAVDDVRTETQVITDTSGDSDIGNSTALNTRPQVYTAGGVLDDMQPPSGTTMCLHKQRLWWVDGSQNQVWFSKSFLDDFGTAPGFSTSFRVQFDQPVTALASMDEKLVAWWSGGIWFFQGGDNIPPDGSQTDLLGPIVVQSDVGCTNPRSVVSMPDGVMFQSARGLYLLTRGLELVWIGRAVKDQLAAFPNVTSAVLVAKYNQVRFTCNNAGASAGIVLVYDYVEKQWSTFKYTDTVTATASCPIADACMAGGIYTFVTPGGAVFQETESTYLDGGSAWVTMKLETAWASAAGPLTYQSVRSLQMEGISNTNHDLTVQVGFDSATSYAQTATFTAGTPVTAIGPLEQCEISINQNRKCQHIRFLIQDATPTNPGTYPVGTGQGPSFDTIGLEVGVKKGYAPNPATKKG